jgi:hypothetical protein
MRVLALCLVVACDAPPPAKPPPTQHELDCQAVSVFEVDARSIDVYCSHVADRCCIGDGQWGCNNAEYSTWYYKYCAGSGVL